MNVADENVTKPSTCQEMGSRRFGHNRRALGVLNQNFVGCVVNKRGLSENNGGCEKKSIYSGHTRKYGAKLSSTHQHFHQETKKQRPSTNEFGDSIFVDADQNSAPSDQPVPMFLEASSTGEMEEVEMEDIIEDIDAFDAKNPLAVVEYIEDMYAYYRRMESLSCVSPSYMSQQFDINENMRAILIDWLIEVHDKFDLLKETLFLTVNLIDRFLSQQSVVRKKLQLVGLVAMLLACKYEEVSVPVVGDLILISDKAYTRKEVLEMENLMLNKFQFNMSFPTPYVFLQRFLKAAQSDKKVEQMAYFLIELSLVEYEMLKFAPSVLAASAVYTAQSTIYGLKQWNRTCEWHTKYSEEHLLECSRKMVGLHQRAGTGKLTGVYRKYNTSKHGYTSKCEAAHFLLHTQLTTNFPCGISTNLRLLPPFCSML